MSRVTYGCYPPGPLKAVILVGGEGTRLRPLTLQTPKPIVPVVDRPFLRYQLDLLASVGVREIVFSAAYRPEKIQAVFGDGSAARRLRGSTLRALRRYSSTSGASGR